MEEEKNAEEEPQFEMTPEEAAALGGGSPGLFNRKRTLIVLCTVFAVVICGGLLLNIAKPPKKKAPAAETASPASGTPSEFLSALRDRAVNRREAAPEAEKPAALPPAEEPEPLLPPASFNRPPEAESPPSLPPVQNRPPPQSPQPAPPPQGAQQAAPAHFRSPLVPQVQGSLFFNAGTAQNAAAQGRPAAEDFYSAPAAQNAARAGPYGSRAGESDYAAQNDQQNKLAFYDSSGGGGSLLNGRFLGENSVWTGTVIPGILETAVNTDLPGNVLARVTQNIYDSMTGLVLLIPQGTLLLARYNSSVSYAQHRVQIVWDALIRPDGFQLDLEGANGVDRSGMSGQAAEYRENWFEYLKAAGIVALFSIADARIAETAAKYASEASAANAAAAGSETVNQLGEKLASRAMNVQPTLTVENGTLINIMLNKTLYLPPAPDGHAARKYVLE